MTDPTMRAAVLVDEGEPETALVVRAEPVPEPAAGEVRVTVTCAALNHLDVWIRKGLPSVPKPRITGADAVGVLDAVGPGAEAALEVAGIAVGDRVVLDPGAGCGACRACEAGETSECRQFRVLGEHAAGTHAEHVVLPVTAVHRAPAHLDDAAAAALTLTHATAWRMLFTRARAVPGETVLVWGASSGVGVAALQLCAAAGIRTIATTRDADKVDGLLALGADQVVVSDPADDDGAEVIAAANARTDDEGVDVAFDHLGRVAWFPSQMALRRGGRYVTCGATTGGKPPANVHVLFWKQLSMLGSTMASRHDVSAMLTFVEHHGIVPVIDRSFDLDDIAAAHRHLETTHGIGKVVVRVR